MTSSESEPAAPRRASDADELWRALAVPASFLRPRLVRDAAILHHIPLLFWMMDTCRPRCTVALGMDPAVFYFAACQATERLGVGATCHGVHEWEDGPPAWLESYNTERYREFSELLTASPGEAAHRFCPGSIDLLLVDLPLNERLAETLLEQWWPRMSAGAVALIHGTGGERAQPGLDRLACRGARFQLDHGEGLTVFGVGEALPERLQLLFSAAASGAAQVRQIFGRMGEGLAAEGKVHRVREKIAELEALRAERDDLAARYRTLEEQYRVLARSAAELRARVFDLETAREAREAELIERDLAYASAQTQIEEARAAQAALQRMQAELADLTARCKALYESTSWKVTAPLRSVVRLVRR